MEWVGGLVGFVEDSVLADLLHGEAEGAEELGEQVFDGWVVGVHRGVVVGEQVGVGRVGPEVVPVAEPGVGGLVGGGVEPDDVRAAGSSDGEPAGGQVEVVEGECGDFVAW